MTSNAPSPAEYLESLPDDRREVLAKVRAVIRQNLPKGFVEQMQYGMIGYVVPHEVYPAGYHCDPKQPVTFAALAAQKNYFALYVMTAYMNPAMSGWIQKAFAAQGKKLDMGKSCIRFKKLDDLPLNVIGELIGKVSLAEYIDLYVHQQKAATKKKTAKKK
jgi:uncharacterized protein YdhG (YjbR/CyaY superfamily)